MHHNEREKKPQDILQYMYTNTIAASVSEKDRITSIDATMNFIKCCNSRFVVTDLSPLAPQHISSPPTVTALQSSEAVWKSRWTSRVPQPHGPCGCKVTFKQVDWSNCWYCYQQTPTHLPSSTEFPTHCNCLRCRPPAPLHPPASAPAL